jgi:hypothetical protein
MVELVDTRDLKSRGPGRVRAGSSPAPGNDFNSLVPVIFRSLSLMSRSLYLNCNLTPLASPLIHCHNLTRSFLLRLRAASLRSFGLTML